MKLYIKLITTIRVNDSLVGTGGNAFNVPISDLIPMFMAFSAATASAAGDNQSLDHNVKKNATSAWPSPFAFASGNLQWGNQAAIGLYTNLENGPTGSIPFNLLSTRVEIAMGTPNRDRDAAVELGAANILGTAPGNTVPLGLQFRVDTGDPVSQPLAYAGGTPPLNEAQVSAVTSYAAGDAANPTGYILDYPKYIIRDCRYLIPYITVPKGTMYPRHFTPTLYSMNNDSMRAHYTVSRSLILEIEIRDEYLPSDVSAINDVYVIAGACQSAVDVYNPWDQQAPKYTVLDPCFIQSVASDGPICLVVPLDPVRRAGRASTQTDAIINIPATNTYTEDGGVTLGKEREGTGQLIVQTTPFALGGPNPF